MKIIAYILLSVIIIHCLLAFVLKTIDWNPWESTWIKSEDEIVGSDGYRYFLVHESSLAQDLSTRLVRTKNVDDEESYETLGSSCLYNSQLPVIWPTDIAKPIDDKLFYMQTSNVILTMNGKEVAFVFDFNKQKYYDHYGDIDVPPFILIGKESVLPKPDVIELVFRVIDDYHGHLESQEYLRNHMSDQSIMLAYEPHWPRSADLKEGMTHPNEEVQRLSKWLLEIQEKGTSQKSETMDALVDYLHEHENSSNGRTRDYIKAIFEYTGWE